MHELWRCEEQVKSCKRELMGKYFGEQLGRVNACGNVLNVVYEYVLCDASKLVTPLWNGLERVITERRDL